MTKRYDVKNGDSIELPDNGVYSTGEMSVEYNSTMFYIAAYDTNGDIVTPSVGTCTLTFANMHQSFDSGASDGDNPIDLTLTGAIASYNVPTYIGCCQELIITISGVDTVTDGIDHFKAFCWRTK